MSAVIMLLLFINELINYSSFQIKSEMFVDSYKNENKLKVNIDIDVFSLPCSLLSIGIQDALGEQTQVIDGNLRKYLLDKNGKIIGETEYNNLNNMNDGDGQVNEVDYEEIKKQIISGEGCSIKGFFMLDAVPGSFHLSSYAFGHYIQKLAQDGLLVTKVEHKINHLMFGTFANYNKIKRIFNDKSLSKLTTSLNGINKKELEKPPKVYQYYLKIVPTVFDDCKNHIETYQYTYSSNADLAMNDLPSIYFRYDISPISVSYKKQGMTFLNFFINVCAILGGVFTVAGIIDGIVHKSVALLLRKAELNKLN